MKFVSICRYGDDQRFEKAANSWNRGTETFVHDSVCQCHADSRDAVIRRSFMRNASSSRKQGTRAIPAGASSDGVWCRGVACVGRTCCVVDALPGRAKLSLPNLEPLGLRLIGHRHVIRGRIQLKRGKLPAGFQTTSLARSKSHRWHRPEIEAEVGRRKVKVWSWRKGGKGTSHEIRGYPETQEML